MKLQRFLTLLLLLSAALGAAAFGVVTPNDFVKPPSNYDPMNIYFLCQKFISQLSPNRALSVF